MVGTIRGDIYWQLVAERVSLVVLLSFLLLFMLFFEPIKLLFLVVNTVFELINVSFLLLF